MSFYLFLQLRNLVFETGDFLRWVESIRLWLFESPNRLSLGSDDVLRGFGNKVDGIIMVKLVLVLDLVIFVRDGTTY